MGLPLGINLNSADAFFLILVRVTGLFVVAPIFGRKNIPSYLKIGFSLLLTIIIYNVLNFSEFKLDYNNIYSYGAIAVKEFIVGVIIGYISYLIFNAIYIAGQMIDMQMGFGMVSIIDPLSNIQVPVTANLYFIIAMLMFLIFNGHHMLISAVFESFKIVPLGHSVFQDLILNDVIRIFGNVFLIGFKISAPILAVILITDVALGVLSRTVPQLNVFVVGMPLKIIVGLLIMIITIPAFIEVVKFLIKGTDSEILNILKIMAKVKAS